MNATSDLSFPSYANLFNRGLSLEALRTRAPAVFAPSADERLSAKYTFVPSERVLTGLMSAGFLPVDARQASARRGSPLHARHVVRLRPRFDTVQLKDSVAELSAARHNSANHQVSIMRRCRCEDLLTMIRTIAFPSSG